MVMTDLCDPYGDSAMRDGGFQNLYPEPKSYLIRFSVKHANVFLLYLDWSASHADQFCIYVKLKPIYIL